MPSWIRREYISTWNLCIGCEQTKNQDCNAPLGDMFKNATNGVRPLLEWKHLLICAKRFKIRVPQLRMRRILYECAEAR